MHGDHITNNSSSADILEGVRTICDTSLPKFLDQGVNLINLSIEFIEIALIGKVSPSL
jgi:hypothetical protein